MSQNKISSRAIVLGFVFRKCSAGGCVHAESQRKKGLRQFVIKSLTSCSNSLGFLCILARAMRTST